VTLSDAPRTLRIESTAERIAVFREGSTEPLLVQNAEADHRPFIHPILVPNGSGSVTENAPGHHPWQHGLYIGLNDVNGTGFWAEGLQASRAEQDGTFHPQIVGVPSVDGSGATWTILTEYRDERGDTLLHETQEWALADFGDRYELDLVWTLKADVPLTFGEYEYGGLFLRMPFRRETGGSAFNSEGQTGAETEGQRATWVASQMPIEGNESDVLVAVLDHPSNLEHPVPWRVDNELGISPSACIAGPWTLATGEERVFRHGVVIFGSPVEASVIEEAFSSFSAKETA
jgi:hypothetical protein